MRPNVLQRFPKALPWLLIIGLVIRQVMSKAAPKTPVKVSKPIRLNNPFSLIQEKPSKWVGLKPGSKGFLEFDKMALGVRAGFINLLHYLEKRRLDTIEKILPVYAPVSDGNDPEAYIRAVSQKTGISRSEKIDSPKKLKDLGRAIIQVETGSDVSDNDFEVGYSLVEPRIKLFFE